MGRSPDDSSDEAAERFFQALQKPTPPGEAPASPGADALRQALLAQDRVLREAEGATAGELTDDERRRMENVRRMLVNQGALREPGAAPRTAAAPAPSVSPLTKAWSALRTALLGTGTPTPGRGLAYAAVLAVCTVLVVQTLPGHDPEDTLRGSGEVARQVTDPAAEAARLSQAFQAAGAEVTVAQLNDNEWAVEIDVPPASQAHVDDVAKANALALSGSSRYSIKLSRR